LVERLAAGIALAGVSLLAMAGCGEEEGVAEGAVVNVYAEAAVCAGAESGLERAGDEAGGIRVRIVCLPDVREGGRLDLAGLGANARRAAEDSSAVAYLEGSGLAAAKFSRPIVETAGIASVDVPPGQATRRILAAIAADESGRPRDAVFESAAGGW
jgi:hypothetical protein